MTDIESAPADRIRRPESPAGFDWRGALRAHRRRRRLTQADLALASGVSVATVRAYERGARQPSGQGLTAIVRALGMPRQDANRIFAGAGYSVDWSTLFENRYIFDLEQAQGQLDLCQWPAFLADQGVNLVAANRAFERVWDVDLTAEFLVPGRRNFMAGASDPRFARCIENFDEVVAFLLGLAKGDPRVQQDMERPAPWLQEALAYFLEGDPALIKRVLDIWERAEPIPHRTRHQYLVRWLYRGEWRMTFNCVTTIADIWNEVSWNDWIPADPETWVALREIAADR